MSDPYLISDDEEDSGFEIIAGDVINDFDLLSITDLETSDVEIITIEDDEIEATSLPRMESSHNSAPPRYSPPLNNGPISLPDIERRFFRLNEFTKIKPGDTVELMDQSERVAGAMHSGDFLRVKHIIQNTKTDRFRLRGHRLRRTKYHGQYFDWKQNELVMLLQVTKGDSRPPSVQGMQDISVEEVIGVRDCVITSKPYPMLSFRDLNCSHPAVTCGMSKEEHKAILFQQGRLVCRHVHISITESTGKSYAGEVRMIYARESDVSTPASSNGETICIDSDSEDGVVVIKNRSQKRRSEPAVKKTRYTFGDVFCGVGGASQGAVQAGLHVLWGVDKDDAAIKAYHCNHTGAEIFLQDAHDFPPPNIAKISLRVDILHLSPPCCYWSPAHTNPGSNDQANFEAIYTVGPILNKLKPRIATLEQTFGLLTMEQHQKIFRFLVNDMHKAGYNLRWKIENLSEFGLPQERRRLLVIAARIGTPLPPFPKPTHGKPGSGLKRFVSVANALNPLDRLAPDVLLKDDRHQPSSMKTLTSKISYDPHKSFLKGCITTGGGTNYHFSGNRRYTPRENSLFQTFPYGYHFTGSNSEANKQIGNAFPPCMSEKLYRSCAQTLEAYDSGLVEAEADITDLDQYLEANGVVLPQRVSTPRDLFAISASSRFSTPENPYRYLFRPENGRAAASAPRAVSRSQSLFGASKDIEPQSRTEKKKQTSFFSFLNNRYVEPGNAEWRTKKRRDGLTNDEKLRRAKENGNLVELDSD